MSKFSASFQNPYCMTEYYIFSHSLIEDSVFFKFRILCLSAMYPFISTLHIKCSAFLCWTLYDRVECLCQVYIVSLDIVCILLSLNLSSKQWQRGATIDTQFRDSWMSMRLRTPMMRKTMNRSRIFEIKISLRA